MNVCYRYPRPALTVDCVMFAFDQVDLQLLLVQRKGEPFAGRWALPGGFVDIDESLEDAARRELREETNLDVEFLEQLYTFGAVDRDPRERVVSVAYYALVNPEGHTLRADSDASSAAWFRLEDVPPLAFDHDQILAMARQRLQAKVRYQPIGFELLPRKFTLGQLQRLYEVLLDRPLDKRNFRKKILSMGLLSELDEVAAGVPHRAPRLYRFDRRKYRRLTREGFHFEL